MTGEQIQRALAEVNNSLELNQLRMEAACVSHRMALRMGDGAAEGRAREEIHALIDERLDGFSAIENIRRQAES